MISHHVYTSLALAHKEAQMEAARQAHQARSLRRLARTSHPRRSFLGRIASWLRLYRSRVGGHRPRPGATGRPVVLRDGSTVLIRQVRGTDAPLLADGFARLGARSRQMRFLTRKNELTESELRYFTEVDHHDHEALGTLDRADGRGVGVARYVRDAGDPQAAEIAVTVVDDWQGRGLGTELLAQLTGRARCEGIRRFTALVSADNAAMARLLRNVNAEITGRGHGAVEYEIALAPGDQHNHAYRPGAATAPGQPLAETT